MARGKFFIQSTSLSAYELVAVGPDAAIESFARLYATLSRRCGADVADLFAEPVVSRGNGAAPTRIEWYCAYDGIARPLNDVDPDAAAAALHTLKARLSTLRGLAYDAEIGPTLVAALNLGSPAAILTIGGQPCLIDWGMLPAKLQDDQRARAALFAATLGPYLPQFPTPAVTLTEWASTFGPNQPTVGAPPQADVSRAAGSPAAPQLVRASARRAVGLVAPAVAVALAALTLGVLNMPGILDFGIEQAKASEIEQAILRSIILRRDQLDRALAADCAQLGNAATELVPPAPEAIKVPPSSVTDLPKAAPGSPSTTPGQLQGVPPADTSNLNLADRLGRGVVMVQAGDSSGTGFFITPDTILTNRHVIANRQSFKVLSKYVGIIPATLVKISATGDYQDFAVLKVTPQPGILPFAFSHAGRPLMQVVATGFPGLYRQTDPVFQRIAAGDTDAVRQLTPVLTTGVINQIQQVDGSTLVIHGAEISPGNSGGPLTDTCGNVLGINTFGIPDRRLPVTARYALGDEGIRAFLQTIGIQPTVRDGCQPVAAAPGAGTSAPAPPAATSPPLTPK